MQLQWSTIGQLVVLAAVAGFIYWLVTRKKHSGGVGEMVIVDVGGPVRINDMWHLLVRGQAGDTVVAKVKGQTIYSNALVGPSLAFDAKVTTWPWAVDIVVRRGGKMMLEQTLTPQIKYLPPVGHSLWANGNPPGYEMHDKVTIDCRYLEHGCNAANGKPTLVSGIEDLDYTQSGKVYSVLHDFTYHVEIRDKATGKLQPVFVGSDRHKLGDSEWRKEPVFTWFAGEYQDKPRIPYDTGVGEVNSGWVEPGNPTGQVKACGCTPVTGGTTTGPTGVPNTRITISVLKYGTVYDFNYDVYVQPDAC